MCGAFKNPLAIDGKEILNLIDDGICAARRETEMEWATRCPGSFRTEKSQMIKRHEIWRDLERDLTSLVSSLSAKLSEIQLEDLNDFIQNYEYGVALEWLCSIIFARSIQLSAEQEAEIRRLAQVMKIDLRELGMDQD